METQQSSHFNRWLVIVLVCLYLVSLAMFLRANYMAGDSAFWQLLVSGILLSVPLILFYGMCGVLIVAALQKRQGAIEPRLARLIYWSPRIAGILIIVFVSMFALDVFSPEYTLAEMLLGFLMHMLPSIFMMIVLALAWRWEWVGFFAFLLAALFFMRFLLSGNPGDGIGMFLLFSGPMLLIALLFGANWRWHLNQIDSQPKPV